jgi:hypothetical protein
MAIMKKFVLALAVCGVLAFAFNVRADADGIKEGKWTMTMVTKMDGLSPEAADAMKQMQNLPPEAAAMMQRMNVHVGAADGGGISTTVTQCITNQNPVPKSKMAEDCQETHDKSGDTINFHMTCNKPDFQMDSTGHVTYTGSSMEGQIKSHQVAQGRDMNSTIDISGQYLGPCS